MKGSKYVVKLPLCSNNKMGYWSKLSHQGTPQVLVFVSICQRSILGNYFRPTLKSLAKFSPAVGETMTQWLPTKVNMSS